MNTPHIFKQGKIGTLELRNRIVLSPMSTLFCEADGSVNDTIINWYARRAKGGAGLIVVEPAQVATSVDALRMWANVLSADDDHFVPGLTSLAKAVHNSGAKIGIQISPGAGAQAAGTPWATRLEETIQQVSPSGIPALHSSKQPRTLSISEIERIIEACALAALRVKNAGFDLINLHGHGGYLLAQFLSPYFNRRTDRYGGTVENRFRFLLEMLQAIRRQVGTDYPVTVKYSIDEYIEGGRGVDESKHLAERLEEAGTNGIFIAVGTHGSRIPIVPPHFIPPGSHVPLAQAIKEVVEIPVVVGGRLNAPHFAEQVLRRGDADFIALGRALIADPDWPEKLRAGQMSDIRPCLACNVCRQRLFTSEPIRCAINAVAGREGELGDLQPAARRKKVMVVGGGPAGLETARVAAMRGHDVVLCERSRRLGGLLALAGVFNKEITPFANWLKTQVRTLPIDIRLKTEASRSLIESLKPDAIVFATGGEFLRLHVPGDDRKNVFDGHTFADLVQGRAVHKGLLLRVASALAPYFFVPSIARFVLSLNLIVKKRVAVIGGQLSGCKLAFHLARTGKEVTIIEETDTLGADMEETTMDTLNYAIEDGKVRVLTSTTVNEVTSDGILLTKRDGTQSLHKADTVMVALGLGPKLHGIAADGDPTREIYVIGDCKGFRGIRDAISEGYVTGYSL